MVGKAGRVGRIQADIFLIDGLQGTVKLFLPCFIGIVDQVKTTSMGKFGKTFSVSDARLASALIRVNSSVSGIGCSTL